MSVGQIIKLAGVAVLALVVNVACAYAWVAVYSYLINPGHDVAFYQAYAQVAAPYSSIIAGMPIMYVAGRWVGGWWGGQAPIRNAMAVWFIYLLIDVGILVSVGVPTGLLTVVSVAQLTKGVAAYLGGRGASRRKSAASA